MSAMSELAESILRAPPLHPESSFSSSDWKRFWSKVDIKGSDECWPWIASRFKKRRDYGAFGMPKKGKRPNALRAHRVAYAMVHGALANATPVGGVHVAHSCDFPPCCNPRHLVGATKKWNEADKIAKRRHHFGSRSPNAKLTEAEVATILRSSSPMSEMAAHYGVSPSTVFNIVHRKTWRHVEVP